MSSRRTFLKHSAALAALPFVMQTAPTQSAALEPQTVALPKRSEVATEHTWDLTPLFKNDEEWKIALEETRQRLPEFKEFEGNIHIQGEEIASVGRAGTIRPVL